MKVVVLCYAFYFQLGICTVKCGNDGEKKNVVEKLRVVNCNLEHVCDDKKNEIKRIFK